MAEVSIRNLSKVYENKTVALDSINLEIASQDFVVVVGPSGCGKTTLLMLMSGLEEVTSGEIWIDKMRMNDIEPKDRDIALVFQSYALYPYMSVYDNMAFSLKLRHQNKSVIKRKVLEVAEMLELTDVLARKPSELSGGEKQRVAIGRAIVRNPKVFLMDEPLSNLDVVLKSKMREELKKIHNDLNATFIYVTHDQVEAMSLATKIVILNKGKIQQVGTPYSIYMYPANMFVAGFIGTPKINFFQLSTDEAVNTVFHKVFNTESLKKAQQCDGIHEKKFWVGIRPEDFYEDENGIEYRIMGYEMLGSDVVMHGSMFVGQKRCDVTIKQPCKPELLVSAATIRVLPKLNKIHLFDFDNRQRIQI